MIIFLYGPDTYRQRQKIEALVRRYREKHSLADMGVFDMGEEGALETLAHFCESGSLFTEKKLAIVGGAVRANASKKERDFFSRPELLSHDDIILILTADSEKVPKRWKFLCAPPVRSEQFLFLQGAQLKKWIMRCAQERSVSLSPKLTTLLASRFAKDTWALHHTIEKLSLLGKSAVDIEDIQDIVSLPKEENFYAFCDAVWQRSTKRLPILERFLMRGEDPYRLLATLATQSRVVTLATHSRARDADAHPYVIKKLSAAAKSITKEQAAAFHERLADHDIAIKSGEYGPEDALIDIAVRGVGS